MTTTASLLVSLIESGQSQKEVTANEAFNAFDKAISGVVTVAVTGGAVTLSNDQAKAAILEFTGALTSGSVVSLPARSKLWLIRNQTTGAFALTVKTSASPVLTIGQGKTALVFCDGADLRAVNPYDPNDFRMMFFVAGKPSASEIVLRTAFVESVDFASAVAGSVATAETAATASTVFTLKKNGTAFGDVTFTGSTGAFTAASATSFVSGDVLSVHAPASPDATLADISITLKGLKL